MPSILAAAIACAPVSADPTIIQVALFQAHPKFESCTIKAPFCVSGQTFSSGSFSLKLSNTGKVVLAKQGRELLHGDSLVIQPAGNQPIAMEPDLALEERESKRYWPATNLLKQSQSKQFRRYRGTIVVFARRSSYNVPPKLRVVNHVPPVDYLESVVGSETLRGWPLEALKAQAVLTQTRMTRIADRIIEDTTQDEAYLGSDYANSPGVKQAVQAVLLEYLSYENRPAIVFYHSTCAGRTSSGADILGEGARSAPYLKSVPCKFCHDSPFYKPTKTTVSAAQFATVFGDKPTVLSRDEAGRPLEIKLHKDQRDERTTGYRFWILLGQNFGWDKAPGLRFSFKQTDDQVQIESTGAGHGVGLCQWGAANMAKAGKSYREILQYYLPGTKITGGIKRH